MLVKFEQFLNYENIFKILGMDWKDPVCLLVLFVCYEYGDVKWLWYQQTTLAMEYCWFSLSHWPIAGKNQNCSVDKVQSLQGNERRYKTCKDSIRSVQFFICEIFAEMFYSDFYSAFVWRHLVGVLWGAPTW